MMNYAMDSKMDNNTYENIFIKSRNRKIPRISKFDK